MRVGTKSVLFGVHCWFIHPWFVAAAWWRLYGFPRDPRLWVAFFVHDLGYFGKPNMDGPEGETHVELGARIMHALFDWGPELDDGKPGTSPHWWVSTQLGTCKACGMEMKVTQGEFNVRTTCPQTYRWHKFCLYHSRFYAKRDGKPFSRLCVADKLALVMTPAWLYLFLARASGELKEYMSKCKDDGKYTSMNVYAVREETWLLNVKRYLLRWVAAHRYAITDTMTPDLQRKD